MRLSSKRYHWESKQGCRDEKAERISRLFKFEEETERNRVAHILGEMPSPRGASWRSYIEHQLRVMDRGIETYTVRSYARLRLDKHIGWHRAIDKLAGKLVNHKPAIIYMGASGSTSPNSPIKIKKHVRCPGTRKLIEAFQKRGNCIIRMVDEWMTSQHCARCFKQFDRRTRSHRFKKCENCVPNPRVWLPELIVTNVSKRALQMKRAILSVWRDMKEMGDAIATAMLQPTTGRLVSKKQRFWKIWPQMPVNVGTEEAVQPQSPLTTVWHRDIVAAKLILYKGMH